MSGQLRNLEDFVLSQGEANDIWNCSTMLIDYIKVIELSANDVFNDSGVYSHDKSVQHICDEARQSSKIVKPAWHKRLLWRDEFTNGLDALNWNIFAIFSAYASKEDYSM